MADILRIKRRQSGAPGAPTSLANAEIAYNEVDHTLYYGEGTGGAGGTATVVVPIGGSGLLGSYLPLIGGTLSGPLHINASPAANATLFLANYTGGSNTNWPAIVFDRSAGSPMSGYFESDVGGVPRWSINFGNSNPESGVNNTGTNFDINRFDDTGHVLNPSPFAINRATGMVTLAAGAIGPTPANGDNSTLLATTAFVHGTRLDQLQPPTAAVPWNNQYIQNLLDPFNPQDAATKSYVDSVAQGIAAKGSCVAATAGANITLSGVQTIDGITVAAGDRVLVKDQTTAAQNGIYVVAAGAWTRSVDTDTWAELVSAFTFIEEGAVNADSGFLCTVDPGGALGSTPVTWVQFSGAGQIVAGAGLQKVGNTLNVLGTAGRIAVGTTVDIDGGYPGQASIVTLGAVSSGTWNATTVDVAHGGSGATSLTGYLVGNGNGPFTAVPSIPVGSIAGLGTMSTQNANAVAITGGTIDGVTFDCGTF